MPALVNKIIGRNITNRKGGNKPRITNEQNGQGHEMRRTQTPPTGERDRRANGTDDQIGPNWVDKLGIHTKCTEQRDRRDGRTLKITR